MCCQAVIGYSVISAHTAEKAPSGFMSSLSAEAEAWQLNIDFLSISQLWSLEVFKWSPPYRTASIIPSWPSVERLSQLIFVPFIIQPPTSLRSSPSFILLLLRVTWLHTRLPLSPAAAWIMQQPCKLIQCLAERQVRLIRGQDPSWRQSGPSWFASGLFLDWLAFKNKQFG